MFDYLKALMYELKHTYFNKRDGIDKTDDLAFFLNYRAACVIAKIINLRGVNNVILTVIREALLLNNVSSFDIYDGDCNDLSVDPKYLRKALLRNWRTGEFDLYLNLNQIQIYSEKELRKLDKSRINKLTVPLASIVNITIYRNGYNFVYNPNFYSGSKYADKLKKSKIDNVVQFRKKKRSG